VDHPVSIIAMILVDQFGTFDVENYGDLLYPLVFQRLLKDFNPQSNLRRVSFLGGHAPQNAGYDTQPARTLFESTSNPRHIVVGGGDLLRTDWQVVAAHYQQSNNLDNFNKIHRALGTPGTLQYVLRKNLPHTDASNYFARRFRQHKMNYPGAGPFMINGNGNRVHYLSCGVPRHFKANEVDAVRQSLDEAEFIYLRDRCSAEKLRRAGVKNELHVAPDLILLLSDQFKHADEVRKGRELVSKLGVNPERRFICFQSQPYPGFNAAEIAMQLIKFGERTDLEIVLLPLGRCHGDYVFLKRIADMSGRKLTLADHYSIFDCLSVIAASDLFVGTSLHGNMTAFSFGIPILYGPLPVDKAEGFLDVVGLPRELKLRSWEEFDDKLDVIRQFDGDYFSKKAYEAKLKVYEVVNRLLKLLQS
jgi:hypothetical protein